MQLKEKEKMDKKKVIVFTGGGTAGHVTPNIAIMNALDQERWTFHYIGSHQGIEKELIMNNGVPYHGISSGKLRRYIDLENIKDPFRVLKGIWEARKILQSLKPQVVFSKGGFVSVPVVIAAKTLGIPVFLHESDITPGLANRIVKWFAAKIFTSFEETAAYFPKKKTYVVGSPIREDLFLGDTEKGKALMGFYDDRPILTIMGGSLGSKRINEAVREVLPELLKEFQVMHLCGKGNIERKLEIVSGYKQVEYLHDELPDILAATDYVITRGGSNAIFEFLSLHKPMLIIPLPENQSRGDQILNAKSFAKNGFCLFLEEKNLVTSSLLAHLRKLQREANDMKQKMGEYDKKDAVALLAAAINEIDH